MTFTKDLLVKDLRRLGVHDGMIMGVHSSLRAVGKVDGGAETVIDALLEAVGETGTLVMPTHSDPVDVWRQDDTPSNCGYLTECFRRRSGVRRSPHPTHSVSAFGPDAEWLAAGHPAPGGEAENCPFHRLALKGGHILMLGVRYNACTLIHVAEELEKVSYLPCASSESYARAFVMVTSSGEEIPYQPETFPGCSFNFRLVEDQLQKRGLLKEGEVGEARSTLAKGTDILEEARATIRREEFVFLCDRPDCSPCARRRCFLRNA